MNVLWPHFLMPLPLQPSQVVITWKTSLVCPPVQEGCVHSAGGFTYDLQLLSSRTRSWHYKTTDGQEYAAFQDFLLCLYTVLLPIFKNSKILALSTSRSLGVRSSSHNLALS